VNILPQAVVRLQQVFTLTHISHIWFVFKINMNGKSIKDINSATLRRELRTPVHHNGCHYIQVK
jgi:hypothetical protein